MIASFDQNQLRVSLRYYSPLLVCNTKQISTKTKLTNNIKDFSFMEAPIQPTTGTIFPCPRLQTLHLSEQNSFSSLLHKNIPRLFPSIFLPTSKLSQHHEKRSKSFVIVHYRKNNFLASVWSTSISNYVYKELS